MSIAVATPALSISPTWRRFQWACVVALCVIGVGCVFYVVETFLLRAERRFAENPAEVMMRALGTTHFTLAWIFTLTSPRLRNRAALARLTFCALFGLGFCALFAWGGGDKNPLGITAFYAFFFIHETYDEAHLFQRSGELPSKAPQPDRILGSLALSISLTYLALLSGFQLARGPLHGRADLMLAAQPWLLVLTLVGLVASAIAWLETFRRARRLHGSVAATVQTYHPLLTVYAASMMILMIGTLFGSIGYNLLIMIHGFTWLLFACDTMKPAPRPNLWTWLRQTPTGLISLHIAMGIAALILFALRTHVWDRSGLLCDLISKSWFPYWAIMHIATSFWRK